MPLSLKLEGSAKNQLVVSLSALLLNDCGAEITADNIKTVASASGNDIPSYFATLYAAHIEKAGGVTKFFSGPSASGGAAPAATSASAPAAAGAAVASAPAPAAAPEKPKEEEVDALDGGMDMFGGGGGGGDY